MKRILGIDYGEARIGLAVSDALGFTAQGLETVEICNNIPNAVKQIVQVICSYDKNVAIEKIVVGMPKHMNGDKSATGEKVEYFCQLLTEKLKEIEKDLPIVYIDERLTTVRAYKTMRELNVSQKQKKQYADRLSAVYILEDFLKSRG